MKKVPKNQKNIEKIKIFKDILVKKIIFCYYMLWKGRNL